MKNPFAASPRWASDRAHREPCLTGESAVPEPRLSKPAGDKPAAESATDESISGPAPRLTHVDAGGNARMVDIGSKPSTRRVAIASGRILMSPTTSSLVAAGNTPKANPIEVARIAGIQAAKKTSELIPLCHPLSLDQVDVRVEPVEDGLLVSATAATTGRTGVEMEALTAAAVTLLTLYDMCKSVERGMSIADLRLEEKRGGRSGTWTRRE